MSDILVRGNGVPGFEPGALDSRELPPPRANPDAGEPLGLVAIIRRHLLFIGACALLTTIAATVVTVRMAPTFLSIATIRIDQKSSQLPALEALGLSPGNALATEVGILQSRALAEEVVDSLGLQLVVRRPATARRASVMTAVHVDREAPPAALRLIPQSPGAFQLVDRARGAHSPTRLVRAGEVVRGAGFSFVLVRKAPTAAVVDFDVVPFRDAVVQLRRTLEISRRDKDADLVDVGYRGRDPVLATDIVNFLSRRFVEGRQEERHAEARGIVAFLRDQIERVAEQLDSSERALREFREQAHVISLVDEASTGVSRQAELRAQRNTLDAERSALQRLLAGARRSPPGGRDSTYRDLLAFPTILQSGTAAALLTPLTVAEGQRNDLLGRRTPQDPDVQVLDTRIAQLHAQIESLVATYLQGLTNQVHALDTIIARSDVTLRTIPRKEIRLAELERNAKGNEAIYSMLQSRLEEAQIAEAASDPSIRLVDPSVVPVKPVAPRPLLNLALALVGGAVLGLVGAGARELSDRSLHTRRELLVAAGVPVIGIVPHSHPRSRFALARRKAREVETPALAQAFSWLATNLMFVRPAAPIRSIVVTSALPGDGKTTVAMNLATTLARHGRRVLLVDGDLRGGRIASALSLAMAPGLSELLAGETGREQALRQVPVGDGATMSVIAAGVAPAQPTQLLASPRMGELLDWARAGHDVTIVDCAPTNVAADAALIAPRSDGVLLVARAGVTERGAVALAMEQLAMVHAPIVGAVLNGVDLRRDGAYDPAYRHYGRYAVAQG